MDIDVSYGRVYVGNDWCSFEFIESAYEKIKPHLKARREAGLIEGECSQNRGEK